MPYTIKVLGYADGRLSEVAGRWLKQYTPGPINSRGEQTAQVVFTDDIDQALKFDDAAAAMELWRSSCGYRPDGKPNRPLTAFTVEISKGSI